MITFKQFITEKEISLYRGSRNGHGRLVIGHEGDNSHTFGSYKSKRYGVFFTKNKKFAMIYGDVDKFSLHVKKIIDLDGPRGKKVLDSFRDYLMDNNSVLFNTFKNIRQTWMYFEDDLGAVFYKYLVDSGYDCAKFTEYNVDGGKEIKSQTYVLLDVHKVRRNPDPKQPDLFLK